MTPRVAVVGSINLDLVARCERLPRPGETVTGATFARYPGGKGANQAVAAARLGARVRMIGCVGADQVAEEATEGLREAGVDATVSRYAGANHGFVQNFSWIPDYYRAFEETAAFLGRR